MTTVDDMRRHLRERAESYARDARAFKEHLHDDVWAAAYDAIARELRRCADHVPCDEEAH